MSVIDNKAGRLFIVLSGFFLANAIMAEFVGVKIFSLEATLGLHPFHWKLLGIEGTLNFCAGRMHRDSGGLALITHALCHLANSR